MSRVITHCQVCGSSKLIPRFFAGYLPLPNVMRSIGVPLQEEVVYPAQLLECADCRLVQLGLEVDQRTVFPLDYSYLSGTTAALRANFADLVKEIFDLQFVKPDGERNLLAVDIGANDGTLLQEFKDKGFMVFGIEPTNAALKCREKGIPTYNDFFGQTHVRYVKERTLGADVVTATNVLAHCPDPNTFVKNVVDMLVPGGVFVSESHYLPAFLQRVQYDTIYHEHLRYYSLASLKFLLERHGLEIVHVREIPTHGGSVRVYAQKDGDGRKSVDLSVAEMVVREEKELGEKISQTWDLFRQDVSIAKFVLLRHLESMMYHGAKVFAIGCPSRAVTLVNYCGLDETLVQCVCEVEGSNKIDHYVPGTMIPVVSERHLYEKQPEYALLLSWHLADELIPKIRSRGFKGKFIVPLPEVKVVD